MKILVLGGGASPERDVSLVSASKIAKALIRKSHSVCVLDLLEGIDDVDNIKFTSNEADIKDYAIDGDTLPVLQSDGSQIGKNIIEACKAADVTFMGLHGDVGENGKVQALLEINGIKHTGSDYSACLLTMNKNISKIIASNFGIKIPKWVMNDGCEKIGFPCVIKPTNGGSSIGVSIVNNEDEYNRAIELSKRYDCNVIIEQMIKGREFSVGVLDGKALPVIEIAPKSGFYDYKNKYIAGMTVETCPALISEELSKKMQEIAVKVHNIFGMHYYSRTDIIVDENGEAYFIEVNALPGMTPTSLIPQEAAAVGMSYEELCEKIALNAK